MANRVGKIVDMDPKKLDGLRQKGQVRDALGVGGLKSGLVGAIDPEITERDQAYFTRQGARVLAREHTIGIRLPHQTDSDDNDIITPDGGCSSAG